MTVDAEIDILLPLFTGRIQKSVIEDCKFCKYLDCVIISC